VNVDDLLLVINQWGMEGAAADLNDSGVVEIGDLFIVIDHWGKERR